MSKKLFFIIGCVMLVIAVVYAVTAISGIYTLPWSPAVNIIAYMLYAIAVVLVFLLPGRKNITNATMAAVLLDLVAVFFLILSIFQRKDSGASSWYLPIALFCTAAANFTNFNAQRKKKSESSDRQD